MGRLGVASRSGGPRSEEVYDANVGFVCVFVAFPALVDWQVDVNYDLWNKESEGYKNFVSVATLVLKSNSSAK